MRQTRAVVISAPGKVALADVMLKEPGPRDVVIQTVFTSISAGTERMLLAGRMPHPRLRFPVVPGYETVGTVVEVGAEVDSAWLGRSVYVGGALCYHDVNAAWGGQAATLFTDVGRLVPLDDVPLEEGVLLALAATALHGVDRVNARAGERVLVLGQGPVGQLAARLVRERGAWVGVTDRVPGRLEPAVGDVVINVADTELADAVPEPVQIIIEATGSMDALAAAIPRLDSGGRVVLLGYYDRVDLPYMPLFLKEAQLITAKEWAAGDLVRCRNKLRSGELDVAQLLTHRQSIADVGAAYETALNDSTCIKLVLDWRVAHE